MRREYSLTKIIVAAIVVMTFMCSQQEEHTEDVIAKIGDRIITDKHLRRSFELDPKWGKGLSNREAYRNQLDYLVSEKLFALEAIDLGMDQDTILSGYLEFIEEKEMIKALYEREVFSKIEISKQELKDAYVKLKKRVRFSYIATRDYEQALKYKEIFEKNDIDSIELDDQINESKGTTDFLTFGEIHPAIESFIFGMYFFA